jgi:hypothetical protein
MSCTVEPLAIFSEMGFSGDFGLSTLIRIGCAGLCLCIKTAYLQTAAPDSAIQSIPPRQMPSDYQAQAKVRGELILAAEIAGHAIPEPKGSLTTDDYVVVETAAYGPPGSRLRISAGDFSLRINGRKQQARHFRES